LWILISNLSQVLVPKKVSSQTIHTQTFSTRRLSDSQTQNLRGHSDGSSELEFLLLSSSDEVSANLLQSLNIPGSQDDSDSVELLLELFFSGGLLHDPSGDSSHGGCHSVNLQWGSHTRLRTDSRTLVPCHITCTVQQYKL
jgi:hypothetical protein